MYKIIRKEHDDDMLLVKVTESETNQLFLYYEDEIPYIEDEELKNALLEGLHS